MLTYPVKKIIMENVKDVHFVCGKDGKIKPITKWNPIEVVWGSNNISTIDADITIKWDFWWDNVKTIYGDINIETIDWTNVINDAGKTSIWTNNRSVVKSVSWDIYVGTNKQWELNSIAWDIFVKLNEYLIITVIWNITVEVNDGAIHTVSWTMTIWDICIDINKSTNSMTIEGSIESVQSSLTAVMNTLASENSMAPLQNYQVKIDKLKIDYLNKKFFVDNIEVPIKDINSQNQYFIDDKNPECLIVDYKNQSIRITPDNVKAISVTRI